MEPKNLRLGGGLPGNTAQPFVILILVLAILLIFLLKRKYVIYPVIFGCIVIPLSQVLVLGGLHFMMLRFVVLAGWMRVAWDSLVTKREPRLGKLNLIDRTFLAWAVVYCLAFIILFHNASAVVNRLGFALDAAGVYFLLRMLIRNNDEVCHAIRAFALAAVVIAACMVNEQVTGHNLFGDWGGMSATPLTREGRLRSQGPFGVSITAGVFGATLLPLFVAYWADEGKRKLVAIAGIIAAAVITFTSASSTPLLAFVAAFIAFAFWPLRKEMRWVRWAIVLILIGLHLVMKAPVWALIEHIDVVGGNSSWHRFAIVDMFIRHFKDWCLVGTAENGRWGWDMWDSANEYVSEGEGGGLLCFILFLTLIRRAFRATAIAREANEDNPRRAFYFWTLGSAVFCHVVAFFGIDYFDQLTVVWYALLAIVGAATAAYLTAPAAGTAPASARPVNLRHAFWETSSPSPVRAFTQSRRGLRA